MKADWGWSFPDALKIQLDRVRSRHAFEPHSILRRSTAPSEFGHSAAFLAVEQIGDENCGTFPNGTQGGGYSHFLQKTSIRGTVSGQRLATLLRKSPGFLPHTQPEGPILLGAWADFRPLSSTTQLGQFVCTFVQETTGVAFDFQQCDLSSPLAQFIDEWADDSEVYNLLGAGMKVAAPPFPQNI
jgi:hypothetical protein